MICCDDDMSKHPVVAKRGVCLLRYHMVSDYLASSTVSTGIRHGIVYSDSYVSL